MKPLYGLLLAAVLVFLPGLTPTGVMSQDGNPITNNCLMSTALGFAGDSNHDCTKLRFVTTGLVEFYGSPSGNDTSNFCLTVGSPCTPQGAINTAMQRYDYQTTVSPIVHLASGSYTTGLFVIGNLISAGGVGFVPLPLTILGAGAATTVVQPTGAPCSANANGFVVSDSYVRLGSMTVATLCAGGSGIQGYQKATIELADGSLQLGPADYGQVYLVDRSAFKGASNYSLSIYGGASVGCFVQSLNSSVLLSGNGAVIGLTGDTTCGAFVDLIDGSIWDPGIGSQFNDNGHLFTGVRYSLSNNSTIDLEDMHVDQLPGTQGNVGNNSNFFSNDGYTSTCVGGLTGCPGTPPTGLGGTGAAFIDYIGAPLCTVNAACPYGSGDASGRFYLSPSSGASSSGDLQIITPSIVTGPGHQGGSCVVSLGMNSGNNWAAAARSPRVYYISGVLNIHWDNAGVSLTPGTLYYMSYACN